MGSIDDEGVRNLGGAKKKCVWNVYETWCVMQSLEGLVKWKELTM